jgi:hypothetical protein
MAHETPAQERKIHKVMHEFKEGKLKSGQSDKKVKSPKQAIAIAMSEAHADKPKSQRSHSKRSQAAHKAMNTREKQGH